MYVITCGDVTIHDPRVDGCSVTDAKVDDTLDSSPTCSFTMHRGHPAYGSVGLLDTSSEIVVADGTSEVFRGRCTSQETDMRGSTRCSCVGQLSYLNDSVVEPYGTYASDDWSTVVPGNQHDYAEWLVSQHNAQVEAGRAFAVGDRKSVV